MLDGVGDVRKLPCLCCGVREGNGPAVRLVSGLRLSRRMGDSARHDWKGEVFAQREGTKELSAHQEDLLKINQLISQVLEKDAALQKLQNQLKFYKLELENREENYNHMFKRQPNVAGAPRAPSLDAAARAGSLANMASMHGMAAPGPSMTSARRNTASTK